MSPVCYENFPERIARDFDDFVIALAHVVFVAISPKRERCSHEAEALTTTSDGRRRHTRHSLPSQIPSIS
jgi:hypothetical protein